jgi:hypothetical protein
MIEMTETDFAKPTINFSIIEPDKDLVGIYDARYTKFLKYQRLNLDLLD